VIHPIAHQTSGLRHVCNALILVLLLGTAACGQSSPGVTSTPTTSRQPTDVREDLWFDVIRHTEAVVTVRDFAPIGVRVDFFGEPLEVYDLDMADLVWRAAEGTSVGPLPDTGSILVVTESASSPVATLDTLDERPAEMTVLLAYQELHDLEWPTRWVVMAVLGSSSGDSLEWLGPRAESGGFNAAFRALSDELARGGSPSSDRALLVDWAAETFELRGEIRDGVEVNPGKGDITRVYERVRDQRSAQSDWYDLDFRLRPLDAALTPPEVFSTLSSKPVLVEVAPGAEASGFYIVIRTTSGVSHIASLAAGSHPATVYFSPGESWELILTRSPDTLGLESQFARIEDSNYSDAEVVLITIRDELISAASEGGPVDSSQLSYQPWSELTRAEFDQKVQEYVDSQ